MCVAAAEHDFSGLFCRILIRRHGNHGRGEMQMWGLHHFDRIWKIANMAENASSWVKHCSNAPRLLLDSQAIAIKMNDGT